MLDYQPPRRRDPSTLYRQRMLVTVVVCLAISLLLALILSKAIDNRMKRRPLPATRRAQLVVR